MHRVGADAGSENAVGAADVPAAVQAPDGSGQAVDPSGQVTQPLGHSAKSSSAFERLPSWVVYVVPAVVEFLIGGYRIASPSLWRDESATISGSQRQFGQIWALMRNQDAVHGPYYFLMHIVISNGGTSETVLRLPSLVAMCLAAAVTGALGKRLAQATNVPAPKLVGLLAGLLLTAVPLTTRYAQEARPYALTTLFAVVSTYLLVRAVAATNGGTAASAFGTAAASTRGTSAASARLKWWSAYGLALTLAGMFNLFVVLLALAHGISLLVARPGGSRIGSLFGRARASSESASMPAARHVPWTPTLPTSAAPTASMSADSGPGGVAPGGVAPGGAGPGGVAPSSETTSAQPASVGLPLQVTRASLLCWLAAFVLSAILLGPITISSVGQSGQLNWVTRPNLSSIATLVRDFSGASLLIPVAIALGWLGLIAGRGLRRHEGLTLAVITVPWLVLPPVLLILVSFVHPVYVERYIMFCLPALSLLLAAGLVWLVPLTRKLASARGLEASSVRALAFAPSVLLIIAIIVGLVGPQQQIRLASARADNLRAVAQVIARHERPGDGVIYQPWGTAVVSAAYPSPFLRLRNLELQDSAVASATIRGVQGPPGLLAARLRTVQRVWTVQWAQPLPSQTQTASDLYAKRAVAGMRLLARWRISSVILTLYATH